MELRILRSIPSSSVLGAFLLALLLPGCATFHHAAPLRTDNVLFWKIRGPANVESEAYLLGSVHVADRPLEVDRRLSNAFAGATQLWLELAPGDMDAAHVSDAFYRYGMLAPKQDITSLLSPQTTELLQRYVNERGTKMESIHGKPWLLSIMIPMEEAARRGFHPELGVDRWFLAHAAGKEVFGLETLDFQLSALDDLPPDLQDLMLRQSLIDREHADKSAASIVAKWEQGDEDGLAQLLLTNPAHPEFAPLVEKLVFERNEKMAQHLESILQTPGTRFVIVGVLHVVGNRGVPAILARDGYEVSPILGPAAAAANDSGLAWMMSR